MRVAAHGSRWRGLYDAVSSTASAVVSMMRGLTLLLSDRPRTPLRILCIVAFDTLHVLRHGKRLSTREVKILAALLDFGACANAAFDRKERGRQERRVTWRVLEEAGIGSSVAEYLRRLGNLERGRPLPGGDLWQFQKVTLYREAVVRLSLGVIATTACASQGLDEAIEATDGAGALNLLFRIVMQCQIMDDVLDYAPDRSAGLPSFLTACPSLPQALAATLLAARRYGDERHVTPGADVFPLRAALFLVSLCTKLMVSLHRWRYCAHLGLQPERRADRLEGLPLDGSWQSAAVRSPSPLSPRPRHSGSSRSGSDRAASNRPAPSRETTS
jgi:hypothetical protein